jgi:hypothetical protein
MYDELLSNVAFSFYLRRYVKVKFKMVENLGSKKKVGPGSWLLAHSVPVYP